MKESLHKISLAVEPQNTKADIPFRNSVISISVNNCLCSLYSIVSLFSNMHICGFYLLIAFGYKTSNQSNLKSERKNICSSKKVQQYISVLQ